MNYEPITPNETQVSDEQPQYLEYGDGMQNGSTTKKEDERVVNSSYELLGSEDTSIVLKATHPTSAFRDSLIDNTAYGNENYGNDKAPVGGVSSEVSGGEDQRQYEEVVVLQNNPSYNYVTTDALPQLDRED